MKNQSTNDVMVMIDGKTFRCDCRCNVFHKPDPADATLLVCNSCGARWRGEQIEDPATTKFFNDRHDARVAAGNQSLFKD